MTPAASNPNRPADALFADLYELTMMQAYLGEGLTKTAVFSLFPRRLPKTRNYLIACGLDTVLADLERLRFTADDLAYLATLKLFGSQFLDWLGRFRFTGDVYAIAEGTPVFGYEPILEIVAPLPEAQLIETFVMNQVQLATLMASKASRVVSAARGRKVIDFGARRTQGSDAANKAARAFYIAGIAATSNLAAGRDYGIPVAGTMGHSYIQAHDSEAGAFNAFAALYPNTTLLIDTYDTVAAAQRIAALARRRRNPLKLGAVRLDSGDLASLSRQVRAVLDGAGLHQVEIIASGGLDEFEIDRLLDRGAPIDAFGVGTAMGVSADAPALDIAYKLTEYDGIGRLKLSAGKSILPGRKQVFRREGAGRYAGDDIGRWTEALPGEPLLRCVMKNGQRIPETIEPIAAMRQRAGEALARLPPALLAREPAAEPYPVTISPVLAAHESEVRRVIAARNLAMPDDSGTPTS